MPRPQKNKRKKYVKIMCFGSRTNAYNYLKAGWEPIDIKIERFGLGQTIILFRLGWLHRAGKPVQPALRDDPWRYGPSLN